MFLLASTLFPLFISNSVHPFFTADIHPSSLLHLHLLHLQRTMAATATQLFCEAANVGKRMKGSKRQITWRFKFHDTGKTHTIELKHSVMTGKQEIFVDKRSIHESRTVVKKIDFVENFHIERHLARVVIKEHFDRYAYSASALRAPAACASPPRHLFSSQHHTHTPTHTHTHTHRLPACLPAFPLSARPACRS